VYTGNWLSARQCSSCHIQEQLSSTLGKSFGEWTVISYSHTNGNNHQFNCKCSCGTEKVVCGSSLRRGKALRCVECKRKLHSGHGHGMKSTSIWVIWMGIKARCLNPNNNAYHNYGGRGITVCEKWKDFLGFYEDMGDRPEGLQIDRIDNDDGYCKENCRWVTPKENCNNRRIRK